MKAMKVKLKYSRSGRKTLPVEFRLITHLYLSVTLNLLLALV